MLAVISDRAPPTPLGARRPNIVVSIWLLCY